MAQLLTIADDFWNIRGAYRRGPVNLGTHCSLVRRGDGSFVLLDSYPLRGEVERQVLELTDGGRAIQAIVNVHPYHTLHVRAVHQRFPHARLYGTARHQERDPDLAWQPELTETEGLHALFADDFDFSVPDGLDFVARNPEIHSSSVLVRHRSSRTMHVDDTFNVVPLPRLLGGARVVVHPGLAQALSPAPGAADAFRFWGAELTKAWGDTQTLCTAHAGVVQGEGGRSIAERMERALARVERTLRGHTKKFG